MWYGAQVVDNADLLLRDGARKHWCTNHPSPVIAQMILNKGLLYELWTI